MPALRCRAWCSSSSQFHLPSFAKHGLHVLVGLRAVGEAEIGAVPFELAGNAKGDGGEGQPLGVRPGDAEIRAAGITAFAGANPVEHVAGRAGKQWRRQHVLLPPRGAGSSHTPSPRLQVAMMPLVPMKTAPLPVRIPGFGPPPRVPKTRTPGPPRAHRLAAGSQRPRRTGWRRCSGGQSTAAAHGPAFFREVVRRREDGFVLLSLCFQNHCRPLCRKTKSDRVYPAHCQKIRQCI